MTQKEASDVKGGPQGGWNGLFHLQSHSILPTASRAAGITPILLMRKLEL